MQIKTVAKVKLFSGKVFKYPASTSEPGADNIANVGCAGSGISLTLNTL